MLEMVRYYAVGQTKGRVWKVVCVDVAVALKREVPRPRRHSSL